MRALVLAVLLALYAVAVEAQTMRIVLPSPLSPTEVTQRQNLCDRSVQAVERKPERAASDGSLQSLRHCSHAHQASAVAAAALRLRASTDTALLARYWNGVQTLDDRGLFQSALELSQDRGAAVPARVYALLTLVRMTRPHRPVRYVDIVGGWKMEAGLRGVGGGCVRIMSSHYEREVVTPLPAEWGQTLARLRDRLSQDESEPLDVRTAASCIAGPPR